MGVGEVWSRGPGGMALTSLRSLSGSVRRHCGKWMLLRSNSILRVHRIMIMCVSAESQSVVSHGLSSVYIYPLLLVN